MVKINFNIAVFIAGLRLFHTCWSYEVFESTPENFTQKEDTPELYNSSAIFGDVVDRNQSHVPIEINTRFGDDRSPNNGGSFGDPNNAGGYYGNSQPNFHNHPSPGGNFNAQTGNYGDNLEYPNNNVNGANQFNSLVTNRDSDSGDNGGYFSNQGTYPGVNGFNTNPNNFGVGHHHVSPNPYESSGSNFHSGIPNGMNLNTNINGHYNHQRNPSNYQGNLLNYYDNINGQNNHHRNPSYCPCSCGVPQGSNYPKNGDQFRPPVYHSQYTPNSGPVHGNNYQQGVNYPQGAGYSNSNYQQDANFPHGSNYPSNNFGNIYSGGHNGNPNMDDTSIQYPGNLNGQSNPFAFLNNFFGNRFGEANVSDATTVTSKSDDTSRPALVLDLTPLSVLKSMIQVSNNPNITLPSEQANQEDFSKLHSDGSQFSDVIDSGLT